MKEAESTSPEIAKYRLLERNDLYEHCPRKPRLTKCRFGQLQGKLADRVLRPPYPMPNGVLRVLPVFLRCLLHAPNVTLRVLQIFPLRLSSPEFVIPLPTQWIAIHRRHYDILHAHYGPVGNSYRFARELFDAPIPGKLLRL